jgi:small-conductance mechanosensitive channel
MYISTWQQAISGSFQNLWIGLVDYLPNILGAVIFFVIGWAVGSIVGRGIAQLFRSARVDEALKKTGADEIMQRGGMELNSGAFIGGLVKWFIILVFLIASFDVLGLSELNRFLQEVVLNYLPNVVVAVLVLLVAGVIADAVQRAVVASSRAAEIRSAGMLGAVSKWAIWIFAFLIALSQLGIAPVFLQTLFTGVIIALSLAIGLAFGLGGQEAAADMIRKVRAEMHHDHRTK